MSQSTQGSRVWEDWGRIGDQERPHQDGGTKRESHQRWCLSIPANRAIPHHSSTVAASGEGLEEAAEESRRKVKAEDMAVPRGRVTCQEPQAPTATNAWGHLTYSLSGHSGFKEHCTR